LLITTRGRRGLDRMVVGFIASYGKSVRVHITTNVASLNPAQVRWTWYNIMWLSLSVTCYRSAVFFRFFDFLHQ